MGRVQNNKNNRVNLIKKSGKLFVVEPDKNDRQVFIRIEEFLTSPDVLDILKNNVGHVTSITASTGLTGGTITTQGTIALKNTTVTPGSYTTANITVDAQGRITSASNGAAGGGSAGTSNEFQITDNSGGFLASVIQQSGTHIIPTTTKVTDLGSASNRFNDLFIDSTIDGDAQLGITNGLTKTRWRSVLAGEGNGIWIGANGGNPTFANRSAFFMLENTDGGFMQPSMTIAQRTAISSPIAGLQVHTEDGTDSIPYYNHSVDGWIPVGRYSGNPSTGTGAKNGQVMASNLDGELVPIRLVGASSTIFPANSSGNYVNNNVNLGSSSYNFLYGYFNRTYVNQVYVGTGTNLIIASSNGSVGGGMRFSSGSGNYFLKVHGETIYKGVSIRDTAIGSADRIEATAVMELQSTTRGFLPPRMTYAQMGAIANTEGLIVHTTDADRPYFNDGSSWKGFGDLHGLFAQTANLTPITTAPEKTLISTGVGSLSIPANEFKVGDSFHAKIGGKLNATGGGGRTEIIIRIKTGTTVLASTGVFDLDNATDQGWELELDFTIATIGATGTICTNGNFVYTKDGSRQVYGYLFQDVQTIDTTVSNTLDITHEYNVINGGDDIYSANFVLHRNYKA